MRSRCEGCGAPCAGPDEPCPWCGAGENEPPSGTSTAGSVQPPPAAPPAPAAGCVNTGVGCVASIVMLALVVWLFSLLLPRYRAPAAGDVVALTNEHAFRPATAPIAVFTTKAALDEASKYKKDVAPYEDSTGGFLVQPGVKVRLLIVDLRWRQVEVRILGGPEKDRTGWLPLKQFEPIK